MTRGERHGGGIVRSSRHECWLHARSPDAYDSPATARSIQGQRRSNSSSPKGFGKAAGNAGKSVAADGGKPAKNRRKSAFAKPAAKAVKFKDDQGHTWGGIGKRPEWFKVALAAGKTPEDLLAKD